ncbi:MAG: adenylyl-sulfate kinase [Anaerolineales bacterium]|nr:adenylyl-sulfate kinase [Anaerolineales bacterium]
MVYWITGRKNSGKTTLAYRLRAQIPNSIVIDGDQVRELWENNQFDKEGREKNLELMARIALLLEQQGHTVIVACVSPIRSERKYYQMWFNKCIEICMPFGELWEGTVYEEPEKDV